jgi:hypothetical protein
MLKRNLKALALLKIWLKVLIFLNYGKKRKENI